MTICFSFFTQVTIRVSSNVKILFIVILHFNRTVYFSLQVIYWPIYSRTLIDEAVHTYMTKKKQWRLERGKEVFFRYFWFAKVDCQFGFNWKRPCVSAYHSIVLTCLCAYLQSYFESAQRNFMNSESFCIVTRTKKTWFCYFWSIIWFGIGMNTYDQNTYYVRFFGSASENDSSRS